MVFLQLQEQLRRRREEEERIAQQNEFLRNSLRGSRKLKALQDTATATPTAGKALAQQQQATTAAATAATIAGVENEAYLPDEDVTPTEHIDGKCEDRPQIGAIDNTTY